LNPHCRGLQILTDIRQAPLRNIKRFISNGTLPSRSHKHDDIPKAAPQALHGNRSNLHGIIDSQREVLYHLRPFTVSDCASVAFSKTNAIPLKSRLCPSYKHRVVPSFCPGVHFYAAIIPSDSPPVTGRWHSHSLRCIFNPLIRSNIRTNGRN